MKFILFFIIFTNLIFPSENCERNSKSFAVIELFTSQGCSDCPSADENLSNLISSTGKNKNILPLSFHVDYWDYIGWKDPYSKSKFSARQRSYSKKLKSSTYTPQIVINGKIDVIGSRKWEILGQVSKINEKNTFIHLPFSTKKKKNEIELKLSSLCKFDKDYIVQTFLVKKKTLDTVTRGENRGKKLQSSNVVIDWKTLNDTDKNFKVSFSIPSGKQNDYFIALYIQDSKNLDIVGVGVEK